MERIIRERSSNEQTSITMDIALYMQRSTFKLQTPHSFILIYEEIKVQTPDFPLIHLKT